MNDREREAARIGMQALDQALVALGYRPVDENPDFRVVEPVVGDLPNTILEKPGVAPLRFVFGPDLDVWVGPFSEVIVAVEVLQAAEGSVQQQIELLLRSSVGCHRSKRWMEVTLQLPGSMPWLRLKVRASGLVSELDPSYAPYAQEPKA